MKSIVQETQKFFLEREEDDRKRKLAFLATEEGLQFASTFKCLKLERLLEDSKAINLLKKDSIIPRGELQVEFSVNVNIYEIYPSMYVYLVVPWCSGQVCGLIMQAL